MYECARTLAIFLVASLVSACGGKSNAQNPIPVLIEVSGYSGSDSIAVTLNGTERLDFESNGTYVFETLLIPGQEFVVELVDSPISLTCGLVGNVGLASAKSVNVRLGCSETPRVSLTVSIAGLEPGKNLQLRFVDRGTNYSLPAGQSELSDVLYLGEKYQVRVAQTPSLQRCEISNDRGTAKNSSAPIRIFCGSALAEFVSLDEFGAIPSETAPRMLGSSDSGDEIFFIACTLSEGCEPWLYDPIIGNSRSLIDLVPGPTSLSIQEFGLINSCLVLPMSGASAEL